MNLHWVIVPWSLCGVYIQVLKSAAVQFGCLDIPSSHTRLAAPEVIDRGLAESVLKPSIGVGTFKKDFFCLTQV